jgi:hypothetical protein
VDDLPDFDFGFVPDSGKTVVLSSPSAAPALCDESRRAPAIVIPKEAPRRIGTLRRAWCAD